ncbi:S-layer homology domain-containing protein [Tepidanaerobacter syntrophicus]|uniref:S-layer homology domain-containing protein n=1 Tax=Tepidanaerobacter syntrophicus TaxID=224999 RepID=A0A0U9HMA3_9FIRM|nr:S-layer homology domain-containing protein [Tepidanaerobacter syntrophicus]GAQ25459.1 S-layer homology domain-containing protein [Tepidanaerobacter syntrophicus]
MKTCRKVGVLFLAAALLIVFTLPVFGAEAGNLSPGQLKKAAKFNDVDENFKWAKDAIERMCNQGVILGYPGGVFRPGNNVTHLEAIIMALRVMGCEEELEDVTINDDIKKIKLPWDDAYYYVALAVEKNIIKPEELKGFNLNAPAKRYEVARYIVRALDMESEATEHMDEELPFKDAKAIPENAIGYVYVAVKLGLMEGDTNGTFKPNEPITRAEMAVLMDRLDVFFAPENMFAGTIEDIDLDELTITLENDSETVTYNVLKHATVYIDGKYYSLKDLNIGDTVKVILDKNENVIFIQVTERADEATTTVKGLVVDVNKAKKSISLFVHDQYKEGFVGVLRVNDIEGRHYELETQRGHYVLIGEIDELEDYVDEKIVVFGKMIDEASIYMRGPMIEVTDFALLEAEDIETFYINNDTKVIIDGEDEKLSGITEGDYAEIKAKDDVAIEIEVETSEELKYK